MIRRLLALAAFLVVTGGITIGIAVRIEGFTFAPRYHLAGSFGDVTGLYVGDPVKLAGVQVGQVTSIHLVHGRAEVGFDVDRDVRVPRTTTAVLRWRNLIGQRDLYLDPGTTTTPTTDLLPTDGSGRVDRTQDAVDIGAVVNALGPLTGAVDPRQLNDIFTAISQALDGNESHIDSLVQHLDDLTGVLASRDQTIQQMLTDYQSVTSVLASRDQQIATMIDNVSLLSQTFTDNTQLFANAIDDLSSTSTTFDALLTANEQQLRGVIDNLATVADVITQKLPQLQEAFGGLPLALESLFSVANGGNFLRVDATCLQFSQAPCTAVGGYAVP